MDKQNRNNYFKLLGSYIGLAFGLIPFLVLLFAALDIPRELYESNFFMIPMKIPMFLNPIYYFEMSYCDDAGCGALTLFTTPFVFFLLGGFIHSWNKRRQITK